MGWLSLLFRPKSRTIQELERAAFQVFYVGGLGVVAGVVLIAALPSNTTGIAAVIGGLGIILAGMAWLGSVSRRGTGTRKCPRCGKENPVFEGDRHFTCVSCGQVVILRDV